MTKKVEVEESREVDEERGNLKELHFHCINIEFAKSYSQLG